MAMIDIGDRALLAPPPSASFGYMGSDWLSNLTVADLRDTQVVSVSYSDAVRVFWSQKDVAFTPVQTDDCLPPQAQITSLCREASTKAAGGFRSVAWSIGKKRYHASLGKLCFLRSVHEALLNIERCKQAIKVLDACKATRRLSTAQFKQAQELPAFKALTAMGLTMSDLGTLHGETWVIDQIIDHVLLGGQARFPQWWRAETTFFQWLKFDSHDLTRDRVQKLRDARINSLLESRNPVFGGVVNTNEAHWAVVLVSLRSGAVFYGCSMGQRMPTWLLDKLRVYFSNSRVPHLRVSVAINTPQQSSAHGSCGIVATNTLLRYLAAWFNQDPLEPGWTNETSERHRLALFTSIVQQILSSPHTPSDEVDTLMKADSTEIIRRLNGAIVQDDDVELEEASISGQMPEQTTYISPLPTGQSVHPLHVPPPHRQPQVTSTTQDVAALRALDVSSPVPFAKDLHVHECAQPSTEEDAEDPLSDDSLPSIGKARLQAQLRQQQRRLLAPDGIDDAVSDDQFSVTDEDEPGSSLRLTNAEDTDEPDSASIGSETQECSGHDSERLLFEDEVSTESEPEVSDSAPVDDREFETGMKFATLDGAIDFVIKEYNRRGHRIMKAERSRATVRGEKNVIIRQRLRCCNWQNSRRANRKPNPLDPANTRRGRKPDVQRCDAKVNIRYIKLEQKYQITLINDDHNHDADDPVGTPPAQASTKQCEILSDLSKIPGMHRRLARDIMTRSEPTPTLTLRQVSNVMCAARRKISDDAETKGGDSASLLAWLAEEKNQHPGTIYHCQVDQEDHHLQRFAAASSSMAQALRDYGDVIIADCTYSRNKYRLPLSVYAVIDGSGLTRNVFYAVHENEDTMSHRWVLRHLKSQMKTAPEVIVSDYDSAFEAAVRHEFPQSMHILCLYHIHANLSKNLGSQLGRRWNRFQNDFWRLYKSPSPSLFDARFKDLVRSYRPSRTYLEETLYPIRQKWASCWTMTAFTAGSRTTGRIESENAVSRSFANTSTTLLDLFKRLFQRAEEQDRNSRERSKSHKNILRSHARVHERIFVGLLDHLRRGCTIHAVTCSYKEMEGSLGWRADLMSLAEEDNGSWEMFADRVAPEKKIESEADPAQTRTSPCPPWPTASPPGPSRSSPPPSDTGSNSEVSDADNQPSQAEPEASDEAPNSTGDPSAISDAKLLSLGHLVRSIESHDEQRVRLVFAVSNKMETYVHLHFVLLIENGGSFCTCGYPLAMGLPCAHVLAAVAEGMPYSLGNIKERWYTGDRGQTGESITVPQPRLILAQPKVPLTEPPTVVARRPTEPAPTQYSKQYVFAEASAHLKLTAEFINDPVDLAELLQVMAQYRDKKAKRSQPAIRDPPQTVKIGRPQNSRLRGATERKVSTTKSKRASPRLASPAVKAQTQKRAASAAKVTKAKGKRSQSPLPSGRPSKTRKK
ncbi:hypothetical protein A4X13_0g7085 [Tilletia indica]|uniref:Uncharacterized protein n=1 Tax=Tilletia indica TaxID=43049 RepID=A0A177TEG5_9BASI|nr:hypothetical protein A4X13_0g7085 [Tilletia indica]